MSNVFGCSACLVAAIELRDEAIVRLMLADSSVHYADIVWLPLPIRSPFHMIESDSSNQIFGKYSLMSCIAAENLQVGVNRCPHPTAIETLEAWRHPNSCVISVVLMAMLFSTPDFNAMQILIESGRFDLREPLVFHQCYNSKNWQFIAVSTLRMALVIDRANYTGAECLFLLNRSLLDASLTSLDGVFIGFHWINNNKWNSFRARDPIAFLFNLIYMFNFPHQPESNTIAQTEMLRRVGLEESSPVHLYYCDGMDLRAL